jgi:hypothetical protein
VSAVPDLPGVGGIQKRYLFFRTTFLQRRFSTPYISFIFLPFFKSLQGVDPCDVFNVTCQALSQCHAPGTCFLGQCSPSLPLSGGTSCEDDDIETLNDTCNGEGVCTAGVRLCEDVTCTPLSQCHAAGVCDYLTGECSTPFKVAGARCEDGDARTTGETCNGQGECLGGEDLCQTQNITCPGETQCKLAGVCFQGICSAEGKASGTSCDDGNPDTGTWWLCRACVPFLYENCALNLSSSTEVSTRLNHFAFSLLGLPSPLPTDDDVCLDGFCAGVDPCDGIVCTPISQCHQTGVCSDGICSTPVRVDGSICDDDDRCGAGRVVCLRPLEGLGP